MAGQVKSASAPEIVILSEGEGPHTRKHHHRLGEGFAPTLPDLSSSNRFTNKRQPRSQLLRKIPPRIALLDQCGKNKLCHPERSAAQSKDPIPASCTLNSEGSFNPNVCPYRPESTPRQTPSSRPTSPQSLPTADCAPHQSNLLLPPPPLQLLLATNRLVDIVEALEINQPIAVIFADKPLDLSALVLMYSPVKTVRDPNVKRSPAARDNVDPIFVVHDENSL